MQSLRRNRDGKDWTRLPAAGRLAPPPEWPAAIPEPNDEEDLKWREMWMLPQALIWELDHAQDLVAFYVRTFLEAMQPRAGAQARMFVRQLSNDLYLAPAALAQGRYVIEGSDADQALQQVVNGPASGRAVRPRGSARNRLTVVEPEADEDEDGDESTTRQGKPETDGEVPPF
jgi:hypothetical protein